MLKFLRIPNNPRSCKDFPWGRLNEKQQKSVLEYSLQYIPALPFSIRFKSDVINLPEEILRI